MTALDVVDVPDQFWKQKESRGDNQINRDDDYRRMEKNSAASFRIELVKVVALYC